MAKKENEVRPIVFENKDTGEKITIEFNREIILRMDADGYSKDGIEEKLSAYPLNTIARLFYYGMLMHQPETTLKEATDFFFDHIGQDDDIIERLAELFAKPYNDMMSAQRKNSLWVVK